MAQQITFAPTELPIDGYFSLRVAEEQFDLYTYSYLRYGKDVGQERFFDMLLAKSQRDAQNRVINPCYWTGAQHSYKVQYSNIRAYYPYRSSRMRTPRVENELD